MESITATGTPPFVLAAGKENTNRNKTNDEGKENDDPYDFRQRFISRQRSYIRSALTEIKQGQKQGCWLWFILPSAPYMMDGIECGSSMNRYFALRGGDICVHAYLNFQDDQINLRTNYLLIVHAILKQLEDGSTLSFIFGSVDLPKVMSSLTLFQRIATEMNDQVLADVCQSVMVFEKSDSDKKKTRKKKKNRLFFSRANAA